MRITIITFGSLIAAAFLSALASQSAIGREPFIPYIPAHEDTFLVDQWTLEEPQTMFGVDNVGLRRGGFVLHVIHGKRAVNLPLMLEDLQSYQKDKTLFARWNAELLLHNLKAYEGVSALKIRVRVLPYRPLIVQEVTLSNMSSKEISASGQDSYGWNNLCHLQINYVDYQSLYVDEQTYPIFMIIVGLFMSQLFYIRTIYKYRPR